MTKRLVPGVDSRKTKPKMAQTIESIAARTYEEGDCMIWTGYIGMNVPQVSHNGKVVAVRRLLLQFMGRKVRPTDYASTRCDNQSCVNPDHIICRSKEQHAYAMLAKPVNNTLKAAKVAAFKRATAAKITMEQAREIRASEETGPVLSKRYGVDKALISRIRLGKSWKESASPFAGLGAR